MHESKPECHLNRLYNKMITFSIVNYERMRNTLLMEQSAICFSNNSSASSSQILEIICSARWCKLIRLAIWILLNLLSSYRGILLGEVKKPHEDADKLIRQNFCFRTILQFSFHFENGFVCKIKRFQWIGMKRSQPIEYCCYLWSYSLCFEADIDDLFLSIYTPIDISTLSLSSASLGSSFLSAFFPIWWRIYFMDSVMIAVASVLSTCVSVSACAHALCVFAICN